MSKKNNWLPNVRVDIPDMEHASHGYVTSVTKEIFEQFLKDDYSRVAEGFRVEIGDQSASPGLFTIYNGAALSQDGTLIINGEDLDAQRSDTITSNATYYIEVELLETESDTEARGVWDPTFDNGQDTSGDDLPDGKEFSQNVATRVTQDWQIVDPISTSGFELSTDADSTKIPIAILTVAGGVISGASAAPARTCLLESALATATSIRMVSTKLMPNAFDATLDVGGANSESITVTANDTKNGILTVSGGIANNQTAGARLVVTDAAAAQFLTERTIFSPAIATAAGDARMRLWQGNEDRGYVLGQNPLAATGNSDSQIASLKDQIDFLAAQIRELKFGAQRGSEIGKLAPPAVFTSEPRYFDRTASATGAKTFSLTIGDGAVQWGDFNRTAYASDDLLLEAAIAALPTGGGTIFIKPGFTLDNFASAVNIPADAKVRFMSDNCRNKLVVNIDATDVATLFDCATGTTFGKVSFENITLSSDNASPMFVKLRDEWDLEVINSVFVADSGGAVAMFDALSATTTIGRVNLVDSSFDYISAGTGGASGRAYFSSTGKEIRNFTVRGCDFLFENNLGGAEVDKLFYIDDWRHDVRFINNVFSSDSASCTAINVATTTSAGINAFGRLVQNCTFIQTAGTFVGMSAYITGLVTIGNNGPTLGVVDNNIYNDTDFVTDVAVGGDFDVTGNSVLSGTVQATGLITAVSGVTAGAAAHITVSGTGRFKHGSFVKSFTPFPAAYTLDGGGGGPAVGITLFEWVASGAADQVWVPITGLMVGDRITSIEFFGNDANAGNFWRGNLAVFDESTGGTAVVSGNADSGAGTGRVSPSTSGLTATTITTGFKYYVKWESGTLDDTFSGFEVTYDRP